MGNVIRLPLVVSDAPRQVRGTIALGDVGAGAGALTVTGGLVSASRTTPVAGQTLLSVVYATTNFVNPIVQFSLESLANANIDNDLEEPVFEALTGTGFDIFLDETNSVLQNLTIHVVITEQ